MNEMENLILQGIQLGLDRLALEVEKQRQEAESRGRYAALPEWLDLEQAVTLKRGLRAKEDCAGGAPLTFYRQKLFLQPCCGRNYKMLGGRKCWRKDNVIEWLAVTDETLKSYAEKYGAELPEAYLKRAV